MKKINKKILGFISIVMFSLLLVACNRDEVIERFKIELYNEDKHSINIMRHNLLLLSGRTSNTQRLNSDIWEYGYYLSQRPEIYVEYERSEDFTLESLEIRDEKNPGSFAILHPQQNTGNDSEFYSIETIGKREQDGESNLWSFKAKITVPEIDSFGEFKYSVEKIKIRLNSGESLDIKLDEVEGGDSSVYLNIDNKDGWDYIDTRLRQIGDEGFTYYYFEDTSKFLAWEFRISYQLLWDERIIKKEEKEKYIYNNRDLFYLVGIREKGDSNKEKLFSIERFDEENRFKVKYLGDPLEVEENSEILNSLVVKIGILDRERNVLDTKEYPLRLFRYR